MSRNNGNGKWIHSYWTRKGTKANVPTKSGWYAAIPDDCDVCVNKVFIYENSLDVYVEGSQFRYDVYDFAWWYPLNTPHDNLPEFRE